MGNCVGNTKVLYRQAQSKNFTHLVHQKQYYLLKLIYADLGSRIIQNQVNLENFLLFFEKNGCWGDRLFKQFDVGSSNLITQYEFIRGIAKIFKTSQHQKIQLLYKFFSGSAEKSQGIAFSDFLKMLFNYPKQQLKQILNDQDFFNKQLRKNVIIDNKYFKGRRLDSIYIDHNQIKKANTIGTTFTLLQNFNDQNSDSLYQNKVESEVLTSLYKKKNFQSTTFNVKLAQTNLQVSTKNINHLIKRFAISVFKSYNINIKTGRLKFQQFKDWMIKHKKLYDNYYKGFHSEVWQLDKKLNKPLYTLRQMEFSSQALIYINQTMIIKVRIYLLRSILIVCDIKDLQTPISIVCLDGLLAKKIVDSNRGSGVQISHRDQIYAVKRFYLKTEELAQRWMGFLKFYKGCSITMLYQMNQKIGVGKFSVVYEGKNNYTGEKCAIKVIQNNKLEQQAKRLIAHESSIMSIVNHPMLIFFKQSIQTKTHIYIITELVRGKDLYQYVKESHSKYLSESESAFIIKQIIVGVKYLHSLEIIHRDLKPENIMIECSSDNSERRQVGKVKIIDFGFSNYLQSLKNMPLMQILVGTPSYIAPELLKMDKKSLSVKSDNFSIGCILYFMLSGKLAFDGYNLSQTLQNNLHGRYQINDKRWRNISNQAKDLVKKLLQIDIEQRLSLQDALNHQWFSKFSNFPQSYELGSNYEDSQTVKIN